MIIPDSAVIALRAAILAIGWPILIVGSVIFFLKVKNLYTKQERQVKEMDKTAKLLVRRDFELLQTNQRLQEIDEAKSHFVSIAAHQLRAPLSAIKWTFHMLLGGDFGKLTDDQRLAVARTMESVERIIALIGDLLSVARIESGQFAYTFGAIAPEMLIDDLIKDVNARLYEKSITLHVSLPDSPLPLARGDREKLLLALQNVLENAITYTTSSGIITMLLQKKNDRYYHVIIADTGMGIPEHQQSLLFQKFFRGDNVVRQQISGTGLGLYITKRIIEAHGGTIAVESHEHKGSVFTITLPFFD